MNLNKEKIDIRCDCGSKYLVSSEHAGKRASCKTCGSLISIPAVPTQSTDDAKSPAASNLRAEAPNPYGNLNELSKNDSQNTCPSCKSSMDDGTIVCIFCGYHTKLKRRMVTGAADAEKELSKESQSTNVWLVNSIATISVVVVIGATFLLNEKLEGPAFLFSFFTCFVLYGLATLVLRKSWCDTDACNNAAIVGLLGMGAARIYYSVVNDRYKFLFLILGMIVAFGVFFLSKTKSRDSDDSPFVDSTGGLAMIPFLVIFGFGTAVLGMVYFVPPIRNTVEGFLIFTIFGMGFLLIKGVEQFTGIELGGRGSGHGGCSSCGGGCGGGCGGCGG